MTLTLADLGGAARRDEEKLVLMFRHSWLSGDDIINTPGPGDQSRQREQLCVGLSLRTSSTNENVTKLMPNYGVMLVTCSRVTV